MISFSFAHFTNAAFASFASLWVCKSVPERVQLISILIIRSQSHHHHHHHFNARSLFEAQRKFKNLTFYDMMHLIFHHCISLSFLHLFSLSLIHLYFLCFFKNGPTHASYSFIFSLFKQTIQFLEQINVNNVMSIQYTAPGFEPTKSSPITTRPGLPPNSLSLIQSYSSLSLSLSLSLSHVGTFSPLNHTF